MARRARRQEAGGVGDHARSPWPTFAAHGVGIALLPRLVAAGDRRLSEIAFAGLPSSDVWMVARRTAAERPQVAAFLKWSRLNLRDAGRAGTQAGPK